MPCYKPLLAYRVAGGGVSFDPRDKGRGETIELPCGRCIGCRLARSEAWAVRCVHEASLWDVNSFVTLTYDEAHFPPFGQLLYRDFQLFMKRLRFERRPARIRFFMGGEYGEELARPHFHAILFNCGFPDREPWSKGLYRSRELERHWPYGFSSIGDVTFESAAYVARYCVSKVTGDGALVHYGVVDPSTGELVERVPEFGHMSLKPGIGSEWLEKYRSDVYPDGTVVMRGRQCKPPKFYDRRFKREDPDGYEALCYLRDSFARAHAGDNTRERLGVREVVARARVNLKKGSI